MMMMACEINQVLYGDGPGEIDSLNNCRCGPIWRRFSTVSIEYSYLSEAGGTYIGAFTKSHARFPWNAPSLTALGCCCDSIGLRGMAFLHNKILPPPSSFIFNSKCMAASLPLPCIHPHSQVHNNDLLAAAAADHATAIYSICTRMCNKMWEKNISIDDTKEAECRRVTAFALSWISYCPLMNWWCLGTISLALAPNQLCGWYDNKFQRPSYIRMRRKWIFAFSVMYSEISKSNSTTPRW